MYSAGQWRCIIWSTYAAKWWREQSSLADSPLLRRDWRARSTTTSRATQGQSGVSKMTKILVGVPDKFCILAVWMKAIDWKCVGICRKGNAFRIKQSITQKIIQHYHNLNIENKTWPALTDFQLTAVSGFVAFFCFFLYPNFLPVFNVDREKDDKRNGSIQIF